MLSLCSSLHSSCPYLRLWRLCITHNLDLLFEVNLFKSLINDGRVNAPLSVVARSRAALLSSPSPKDLYLLERCVLRGDSSPVLLEPKAGGARARRSEGTNRSRSEARSIMALVTAVLPSCRPVILPSFCSSGCGPPPPPHLNLFLLLPPPSCCPCLYPPWC